MTSISDKIQELKNLSGLFLGAGGDRIPPHGTTHKKTGSDPIPSEIDGFSVDLTGITLGQTIVLDAEGNLIPGDPSGTLATLQSAYDNGATITLDVADFDVTLGGSQNIVFRDEAGIAVFTMSDPAGDSKLELNAVTLELKDGNLSSTITLSELGETAFDTTSQSIVGAVNENVAAIAANLSNINTNTSDISSLQQYNTDRADATLEYTGFTNNENITVTYDSVSRTVTLTGTFKAYYQGVEIAVLTSGWTSDPHVVSPTGTLFLKYNGGGFSWGYSPWLFNELQIAYICFNSAGVFCFGQREVHGFMPWQTHLEFHKTQGTYKDSGGEVSGYVLDSTTATDRRPQIAATTLYDEDLKTVIPAHTTKNDYSYLYLTGATGVATITKGTAEIVNLSTGVPLINVFTGGTWTTPLLTNGYFANIWIIAIPTTNDTSSQQARFLYLAPQREWSDEATALSESPQDLDFAEFSDVSPEFTIIGQITVGRTGSNWFIANVSELDVTRANIVASSGGYLTQVTHDDTLEGNGTAADPLRVKGQLYGRTTTTGINTATDILAETFEGTDYPSLANGTLKTWQVMLECHNNNDAADAAVFGKWEGQLTFALGAAGTDKFLLGYCLPTGEEVVDPNVTLDAPTFAITTNQIQITVGHACTDAGTNVDLRWTMRLTEITGSTILGS